MLVVRVARLSTKCSGCEVTVQKHMGGYMPFAREMGFTPQWGKRYEAQNVPIVAYVLETCHM